MQRRTLTRFILITYLALWATTATFGTSRARDAASAGVELDAWSGLSPAPFWVVADYLIWSDDAATDYRAHFIWLPGCVFRAHSRDKGWAGCRYSIF